VWVPVEDLRVDFAEVEIDMFDRRRHWMIAFFILTMVFGFALAKPLDVKI